MPVFDELLAKSGTPLSDRVNRATLWISATCLQPPEEWTNPLTECFGLLLKEVDKWYARIYGRAAMSASSKAITRLGLALHRGLLLRIEIPLTLARPVPSADTFDLHFPLQLEEDERPLDLLVPKPFLRSLKPSEKAGLSADVATIVGRMRRLWSLIVPTGGPEPETTELKNALLAHLDAVARQAESHVGGDLGLATVDLRMCCELLLKLHLVQRGTKFKKVHYFDELLPHSSPQMQSVFAQIPTQLFQYQDVNAMRYGKSNPPTPSTFFEMYVRVLELLEKAACLLDREFVMKGMVARMRKPAWSR